jgi:type IV pilus assembly protein PilX
MMHRRPPPSNQRGFVLATGMVILLMIALLLMYLFRDAILQERMSGNAVGRARALQAAETALRDGEARIETGGDPFSPFRLDAFTTTCTNGLCKSLGTPTVSALNTRMSSGVVSTSYASSLTTNLLEASPRYLIEIVTPPVYSGSDGCSVAAYRIYAKGFGSSNSEVIVQSDYMIRPALCP